MQALPVHNSRTIQQKRFEIKTQAQSRMSLLKVPVAVEKPRNLTPSDLSRTQKLKPNRKLGQTMSLDQIRYPAVQKSSNSKLSYMQNMASKSSKFGHPSKKKQQDQLKAALTDDKKPKFVALLASENRAMLLALLNRMKWKKDKNVTAEHILRHVFSHQYSKSVEDSSIWQQKTNFFTRRRQIAQIATIQKQESENSRVEAEKNLYPQDPESALIDMLWVGSHNPQQLIATNLTHFRVIFNGLDNINEMIDMRRLRDQLLNIRSSIMTKTQHSIPNFLLDKYYPNYSELVSVQKFITFEMKLLPQQLIHANDDNTQKHLVQAAFQPEVFINQGKKKTSSPLKQQRKSLEEEETNQAHMSAKFNLQGFRRSVSFIRIGGQPASPVSSNHSYQSNVKVDHLIKQKTLALARDNIKERIQMLYANQGEFLFADNEEFRQKTQTCYIVKHGFSIQNIIALDSRAKKINSKSQQNVKKAQLSRKLQSQAELAQRLIHDEPIIVRQLLNPLLYHGNNICTISVYVFVESFETLRSFIFNNVKARFRQHTDYKDDKDFKTAGFGTGRTLFRFNIEDLIKLLNRRAGSKMEDMIEQRKVFWNRICQKVMLMLVLMKTQSKQVHSQNKEVSLSKFCHLLQFRFQIDRNGRPWLFGIKSDSTKFKMKDNSFDDYKKYLLLETILCIQKKLSSILRKEQQMEKELKLLNTATDMTGVEKILRSKVEDFEYGMDTAGGTVQNPTNQRRIINRVIGKAKNTNISSSNILKTFHNFEEWARSNLNKQTQFGAPQQSSSSKNTAYVFETNFNANQLASRRIERALFMKLNKNEEQLTNYYKHRYDRKSNLRLDPDGLQTEEQKKISDNRRIYFLGEQQLIEDVQEILQCEEPEYLAVKVSLIKQTGSVLIREGFRLILRDDHDSDIMSFIHRYKLLHQINKIGDEWLENSLKFVIMGIKDPLVFLCQCVDKLNLIEVSKKSDLSSFKILNKYGKIPNAPSSEQIEKIKTSQTTNLKRRQSKIMSAAQLENIIRKGAVAQHIKDNIISYFNEPSQKERRKLDKRNTEIEFEKRKKSAIQSHSILRKAFKANELANLKYEQIQEETSQNSSSAPKSSDDNSDFSEKRKEMGVKISIAKHSDATPSSSSYDINKFSSQSSYHSDKSDKQSKEKKQLNGGGGVPSIIFEKSEKGGITHTKTEQLHQMIYVGKLQGLDETKELMQSALPKRLSKVQSFSQTLKVPSLLPVKKTPKSTDSDGAQFNENFNKTFQLSNRDDQSFYEANKFDNKKQDKLDTEKAEDTFYQNLSRPAAATHANITPEKKIQLYQHENEDLAKVESRGFGLQKYGNVAKNHDYSERKPIVKAEKIDLSFNLDKTDQKPISRQQGFRMLQQTANQLPAALTQRSIPMMTPANKKQKNSQSGQLSLFKQDSATSMSMVSTSYVRRNKARELTQSFNQFLSDNFQQNIPFVAMSQQAQLDRLIRAKKQREFGKTDEQLKVAGKKKNSQSSQSQSARDTNSAMGSRLYLDEKHGIMQATSIHDQPTWQKQKNERKLQSAAEQMRKSQNRRASMQQDSLPTDGSHHDQSTDLQSPTTPLLQRRNTIILPKQQVQLNALQKQNEAIVQIEHKIKRLQRTNTMLSGKSNRTFKQQIGKDDAITFHRKDQKKFIKKIQKMQKEHDDNFSSDDFSSSSDGTVKSSVVSSHSSFEISESSDTDKKPNKKPSKHQKNTRSREVYVAEMDSDDSNKHLGKTKQYNKDLEEKRKLKERIKSNMLKFLKKKQIRSHNFQFKQLYPFNAACNEDKTEGNFKRFQVSKTMTEIHLPLREIRQLQTGDDDALARQYMIENTIHSLMKIMDTQDFSKQISLH